MKARNGGTYLQYLAQEDWEFKANLAIQQDFASATNQEEKKDKED